MGHEERFVGITSIRIHLEADRRRNRQREGAMSHAAASRMRRRTGHERAECFLLLCRLARRGGEKAAEKRGV